jgi:predicted GIY-YIG superfamily endonuclease
MASIYILQLENQCYYVGRSDNVDQRIQQHFDGQGSAWTKLHKPVRVENIISNSDVFDEDKYVKKYMQEHGIDKVRGGSYSQTDLDDNTLAMLQKELDGANNKCFRCGKFGHFASSCRVPVATAAPAPAAAGTICERCGRNTHVAADCYATKTLVGQVIDSNDKKCGRCGRTSHVAERCKAKTDFKGKPLV